MAPEQDFNAIARTEAEQPSSFRQELGIIGRALVFLVGAGLPAFCSLLLSLLLVLFQNWQGLLLMLAFGFEATIFGYWISGRLTSPRLAGLASGALGLEVGYLAFVLAPDGFPSTDEFLDFFSAAMVVIALCHGFATWKLFARARIAGWRNAIETFLAGAVGLASVFYALSVLLPKLPDD